MNSYAENVPILAKYIAVFKYLPTTKEKKKINKDTNQEVNKQECIRWGNENEERKIFFQSITL